MGHTRKPVRGNRPMATRSSHNTGATNRKTLPRKTSKNRKQTQKAAIAKTALGAEPEKRTLERSCLTPGSASGHNSQREATVRVKTAKGRRISSTLWLKRQLNDPYIARARAEGYRSRAAYKLLEIDEKISLFRRGDRVVDLGAAPGGWCQVAAHKTGALSGHPTARVVGIDYLTVPAVDGADILELDFLDETAPAQLRQKLAGMANVVLSDMAAPSTGHRATDHLRIVALAETALAFAEDVLAPQGHFVAKVFQGGAQQALLLRLNKQFATVRHIKPKASRPQSPETYVVALGFQGGKATE